MYGLPTSTQDLQRHASNLRQEAQDAAARLGRLQDSAQDAQRMVSDLQSQATNARRQGEELLQTARDARESLSRLPDPDVPDDWKTLTDLLDEGQADHAEFVTLEDELFDDVPEPEPAAEPTDSPEFSRDEEQATAVLRVCRNGWNTIDTRAAGGHWFSA